MYWARQSWWTSRKITPSRSSTEPDPRVSLVGGNKGYFLLWGKRFGGNGSGELMQPRSHWNHRVGGKSTHRKVWHTQSWRYGFLLQTTFAFRVICLSSDSWACTTDSWVVDTRIAGRRARHLNLGAWVLCPSTSAAVRSKISGCQPTRTQVPSIPTPLDVNFGASSVKSQADALKKLYIPRFLGLILGTRQVPVESVIDTHKHTLGPDARRRKPKIWVAVTICTIGIFVHLLATHQKRQDRQSELPECRTSNGLIYMYLVIIIDKDCVLVLDQRRIGQKLENGVL